MRACLIGEFPADHAISPLLKPELLNDNLRSRTMANGDVTRELGRASDLPDRRLSTRISPALG